MLVVPQPMARPVFLSLLDTPSLRFLSVTLGNVRCSEVLGSDITGLINGLPFLERCEILLVPQEFYHPGVPLDPFRAQDELTDL